MKNWIAASFVGIAVHLLISAALFFGAFAYGMAAFGHDGPQATSRALLGSFRVWNAPYTYAWYGIAQKVLPVIPPSIRIPQGTDEKEWATFKKYEAEQIRISGMHRTAKNFGYGFSAVVGGLLLGGGYTAIRRKIRPNQPPQRTPGKVPFPATESGARRR